MMVSSLGILWSHHCPGSSDYSPSSLETALHNRNKPWSWTRNDNRRLDRLEEIHAPSGPARWHGVIGDSEAELDERIHELIASGRAKPTDGFIRHLIVDLKRA